MASGAQAGGRWPVAHGPVAVARGWAMASGMLCFAVAKAGRWLPVTVGGWPVAVGRWSLAGGPVGGEPVGRWAGGRWWWPVAGGRWWPVAGGRWCR